MIWNIQLVFDAADPDEVMWFWGPRLGYEMEHRPPDAMKIWRKDFPQYEGRGRIDDGSGRRDPIYIQRVPEPKQGPNRVRLEIASPDEPPGEHSDIEGNEYTVVADATRAIRTIVFDCVDRARMIDFWSSATGYAVDGERLVPPPVSIAGGHMVVGGAEIPDERAAFTLGFTPPSAFPDGPVHDLAAALAFRETGEPKQYKNRLHVDLRTLDREAERKRLEALGARVLHWQDDHVMADPEGNEFCVG